MLKFTLTGKTPVSLNNHMRLKMELEFKLSVDEANHLVAILNKLPNESGVYPVLMKIIEQGNAQLNKAESIKSE